MTNAIYISTVEKDGNDGFITTFSDGTTAGYVIEELLALRPCREPVYEIAWPHELCAISMNSDPISTFN